DAAEAIEVPAFVLDGEGGQAVGEGARPFQIAKLAGEHKRGLSARVDVGNAAVGLGPGEPIAEIVRVSEARWDDDGAVAVDVAPLAVLAAFAKWKQPFRARRYDLRGLCMKRPPRSKYGERCQGD